MTDTFRYQIEQVVGRDVVMTIRPTTAGGLCDLAWSRSFAFLLLQGRGLPVDVEQALDPTWLAAHLDEYVTRVVPERVTGEVHIANLELTATTWCIPAEHLQPQLSLRVTLADEALAGYVPEGTSGSTTAFDVWDADPKHVRVKYHHTFEAHADGLDDDGVAHLTPQRAPVFDPDVNASAILDAVAARLPTFEPKDGGLYRTGADADLRVHFENGFDLPRGVVSVRLGLRVPAFETLPRPAKKKFDQALLLNGHLGTNWFRCFADSEPSDGRLEYFDSEAPQEPFERLIDRIVGELDTPELDTLLTRDGLRGLVEHGVMTLPVKKKQEPLTPLGDWPAPTLPPSWSLSWKHGIRALPEPLWTRVALHMAFGTREEAKKALGQARTRFKSCVAQYKPLVASLDE